MSTPFRQPPRWLLEAINTPYERGAARVEGCGVNYLQSGDSRKPGVALLADWEHSVPRAARG